MVLMGMDMPVSAIKGQIASAIDMIVHLGRVRDKTRKVLQITEVVNYEQDTITLNPLYEFQEDEQSTLGHVSGALCRTENKFIHQEKLIAAGLVRKEEMCQ